MFIGEIKISLNGKWNVFFILFIFNRNLIEIKKRDEKLVKQDEVI